MAKTFDADFYVVCATVIPVLFLALTLQGRAYESVLRAFVREVKARRAEHSKRQLTPFISYWFLQWVAVAMVVAGGLGEFSALLALYGGSEQPGQRMVVLVNTLILLAAVVAGPYLAYVRSVGEKYQVVSRKRDVAEDQSGERPRQADKPGPDAD